jgi:hypothetical protein
MNSINPLRGNVEINLGGEKRLLRFNNNAFRIISKSRGVSMTKLFQQMQDPDQRLDVIFELIEAAFRNELAYTGQPDNYSPNQVQAWIGDMQDEDMTAVLEAIQGSVTTPKQDEGNLMAPVKA